MFKYSIRRHKKSKNIKLTVYPDGRCIVTVPYFVSKAEVYNFVREKQTWIEKQQKHYASQPQKTSNIGTQAHYELHKERARDAINDRIECFNEVYRFPIKRISIRNQKSLWGSCSRKGNLNFNYRIIFLHPDIFDYIVVHELCHLKEFNHSPRFWQLVTRAMPNYKKLNKELSKASQMLL